MAITVHKLGTSVVFDPGLQQAAPAVVLFGGLYGWEGPWFKEHLPANTLNEMIFACPLHYTNDCADALKDLSSVISDDKISSYSLCGYSRGGIEVYRYKDLKDWKILGLIDPSAPTMGKFPDTVLDSQKSKIRCFYNLGNWEGADYYPKIQSFHQHLIDIKADLTDEAHLHQNIPKFFFLKYGAAFK